MTQNNEARADDSVDPGLIRPGGVSYLQIPAVDAVKSAAFYAAVFGWNTRQTGVHVGFDDKGGHVSGAWETGRAISHEPGILPYIYVDRIDDTIARITELGGEVVRAPYAEGSLWVATFRDPAGNVIGLWHDGPR